MYLWYPILWVELLCFFWSAFDILESQLPNEMAHNPDLIASSWRDSSCTFLTSQLSRMYTTWQYVRRLMVSSLPLFLTRLDHLVIMVSLVLFEVQRSYFSREPPIDFFFHLIGQNRSHGYPPVHSSTKKRIFCRPAYHRGWRQLSLPGGGDLSTCGWADDQWKLLTWKNGMWVDNQECLPHLLMLWS